MSDSTALVVPQENRAAAMSEAVSMLRRMDAWSSDVIGIGVAARDKSYDARFVAQWILSDVELEDMFDGNWLLRRIVKLLPEECLRESFGLTIPTDDDAGQASELASEVLTTLGELGAASAVLLAHVWKRAMGGGAIYVEADDGQAADMPLDTTRIRSVRFLRVLAARTELEVCDVYADPRHPKWGRPATYWMQPQTMGGYLRTKVHETRLVIMDGEQCSGRRRQQLRGWGQAVTQSIFDLLRDHGLSFAAATQLLNVASQAVFKMQGLIAGIADGEKDTIHSRMELVELYRSICRALLLDAGGPNGEGAESFELHKVDFGGIPEMLDRIMSQTSAATGYPMTVLFGRSPAGMNATGESDSQTMEKLVRSEQIQVDKPALEAIARLVFLSREGPTRGVEPERWEVTFAPQRVPTAKESAEIRKLTADADRSDIEAGVLLAEEVAVSRYGRHGGYSTETTIDVETRKRLLEADRGLPLGDGAEDEPVKPPAVSAATAPSVPEEAKDPTSALNGAQIAEMRETIAAVARGELPRETGVMILASAFPFDEGQAERIMGSVGRGFEAKAVASAAPPPTPPEPERDPDEMPPPPRQETHGATRPAGDEDENGPGERMKLEEEPN